MLLSNLSPHFINTTLTVIAPQTEFLQDGDLACEALYPQSTLVGTSRPPKNVIVGLKKKVNKISS